MLTPIDRLLISMMHYVFVPVNVYVLYLLFKGFYEKNFDDEKLYYWLLSANFINLLVFIGHGGPTSKLPPNIGLVLLFALPLVFLTSVFKFLKIISVTANSMRKAKNMAVVPLIEYFGYELKVSKNNKFFYVPLWASFFMILCVNMAYRFKFF